MCGRERRRGEERRGKAENDREGERGWGGGEGGRK